MRKILLASTALVAFGTVAANAADVTISGTTDWHYINYDNTSNSGALNGSYIDMDQDVDFKFSTTTDSGLTLTMDSAKQPFLRYTHVVIYRAGLGLRHFATRCRGVHSHSGFALSPPRPHI